MLSFKKLAEPRDPRTTFLMQVLILSEIPHLRFYRRMIYEYRVLFHYERGGKSLALNSITARRIHPK